MAPPEHRRQFKRPAISDQQRRRELSLQRQAQSRLDAQHRARCLASSALALETIESEPEPEVELGLCTDNEGDGGVASPYEEFDVRNSSKLRGADARKWFARQLMLPEWMIDIPDRLSEEWF